jgi:protein-S-isoprenylcysteine O-methyltransferase Ste14
MRRKKVILLATLCGAVAGALATLFARRFPGVVPAALKLDEALWAKPQFVLAAVGWVLFSAYWEIAAKNAAPVKSSESSGSRALHVFLANVALLLEMTPIRGLGRFLPASSLIMAGGLVLEAMGLFVAVWSRRNLGRNWSGEITIKVEHQLIRSGPYKLLRHPIYTGLLTMYAGTAIVTGEWLGIIGVIVAAFAYWRKIRLEEAVLRAAFGADYDAYCRETWALAPGLF